MATTSEIQVTEAYIGLLGRAPDPTGLAYWTAQLDDAIAAGQSASDALKKLTNDITLSAEWDTGIGSNDASTQAGAEAIVTAMYDNLFDREATPSDLAYWSAELVNGTTTASEMAVQLIVAAQANTTNTTDAEVLGYKQQAATYYVETVPQANFTKASAGDSVSAVNGPVTLAASKTATDYVASGVGESYALTTATNDVLTGTAGSDTFTGLSGTGATAQATDKITDSSSSDADVLTVTGDDDFNMPTISGVETINVSIAKQLGGGFDSDMANLTGGTVNWTVAENVTIAGVSVPGETVLAVTNLSSNLTTVNVTSLSAALDGEAVTISTDADATSVTVTDVNANDTTIIVGNDAGSTINIKGVDGTATNDAASITANGNVTLVVDGGTAANDVEVLTLAGGTNDVDFAISGVTTVGNMKYTTTGSKAVTLSGDANQFGGAAFTQGATTGLDITGANDLNLTGQGVFAGGIDLSVDMNTKTVTVQTGNTLTISADQAANGQLIIASANDTAADTLSITLQNDTGELTTTNFETVTIGAGNVAVEMNEIDMADNGANVSIVGTNDITIGSEGSNSGTLTISGNDVTIGGNVETTKGKVDIDAIDTAKVSAGGITANDGLTIDADDYSVTGAITVNNGDAVLTGTNDSDVDAVTVTKGDLTMTGNDITIGGAVSVQNDVSITASAVVSAGAIDATGAGTVTISGTEIGAVGAIGASATLTSVTLSASNDAASSDLDGDITTAATGSVTLSDGKFDATGITIDTESLLITGDTDVIGAPTVKAESVTITSTNDVTLGNVYEKVNSEGVVVSAGSASGDITAVFDGDAGGSGKITVVTGSGNDNLELKEVGLFSVQTGLGADTVKISDVAAGSVVNVGDGDNIIDNDETIALTISAGSGNDTYTMVAGDNATVDLGGGTDTVTLSANPEASASYSNIEVLALTGGTRTITSTQLAADNTFLLTGGQTLTVNVPSAVGAVVDAGQMTHDALSLGNLAINGNAGADTITGSTANDVIDGFGGDDTITDTDGTNTLAGNAGNDTITGGDLVDTINGGAGNDVMVGGAGDDVIAGNAGTDTATGGLGADDFKIDGTSDGTLTVTDFVSGTDDMDIAFTTTGAIGTHADVAAATNTQLNNGAGVNEITGTLNSTPTDFSNASQVIDAVGNGALRVSATGDDIVMVVYSGGNAYVYLVADDGTDGNITVETDEITLVATLEGVAAGTLAAGDFI